jgi:hippurate hydrolase
MLNKICFVVFAVILCGVHAPAQTLDARIERDLPSLVTTYKTLHAAPELSHHEEKTAAFFA